MKLIEIHKSYSATLIDEIGCLKISAVNLPGVVKIQIGNVKYFIENFKGEVNFKNTVLNLIKLGIFAKVFIDVISEEREAGIQQGKEIVKSRFEGLFD